MEHISRKAKFKLIDFLSTGRTCALSEVTSFAILASNPNNFRYVVDKNTGFLYTISIFQKDIIHRDYLSWFGRKNYEFVPINDFVANLLLEEGFGISFV